MVIKELTYTDEECAFGAKYEGGYVRNVIQSICRERFVICFG